MHFIVLPDVNLFDGDGPNLAPERSHPIAINLSSRSDQLAWIDKMRRPTRMHMNLRAGFGKAPGGACMIKVDVRHKHLPNVCNSPAKGGHRLLDISKS